MDESLLRLLIETIVLRVFQEIQGVHLHVDEPGEGEVEVTSFPFFFQITLIPSPHRSVLGSSAYTREMSSQVFGDNGIFQDREVMPGEIRAGNRKKGSGFQDQGTRVLVKDVLLGCSRRSRELIRRSTSSMNEKEVSISSPPAFQYTVIPPGRRSLAVSRCMREG